MWTCLGVGKFSAGWANFSAKLLTQVAIVVNRVASGAVTIRWSKLSLQAHVHTYVV